jgi:hypothetical protein
MVEHIINFVPKWPLRVTISADILYQIDASKDVAKYDNYKVSDFLNDGG